jgi:hypothetical protein
MRMFRNQWAIGISGFLQDGSIYRRARRYETSRTLSGRIGASELKAQFITLSGADFVDRCGFYCGNYPDLSESDIDVVCSRLFDVAS